MKKLISLIFIILLIGIITDCTNKTPEGPEVKESSTQARLEKKPIKEYWFSDYFPLNPKLYGIKTYELTVGGTGQFTSKIVGTEIIPYTTGAITGVKIAFGDDYGVYYSEKRYFYSLKDGDYILSTTCGELTAYPPNAIVGKVYDGMILDLSGPYWKVNANDYNDCKPPGDSGINLISIQDVYINGKRYNNSLIFWEFEPERPFTPLNFDGKELVIGLTLPTVDETNNNAITDVYIWGHRKGLLAAGDITAATGELNTFVELVSVSHKY